MKNIFFMACLVLLISVFKVNAETEPAKILLSDLFRKHQTYLDLSEQESLDFEFVYKVTAKHTSLDQVVMNFSYDGQNIELKHQLQLQDRNAILAYKRNHGQRTQLEIYSRRGNWQTSSKSKQ